METIEAPPSAAAPSSCQHVSGIVLAGSYEWSGSPFERLRPRPLLPVALNPIISYVLNWLDGSGIPEAVIVANGATPLLRRHLDEMSTSAIQLAYHEDRSPRGAAGCVKDAAAHSASGAFIVTDGASIPTANIQELTHAHHESGAGLTIVVHRRVSPYSSSPQFYPTGTYVFDRDVLNAIPATSFHDIKESLIPRLYREGYKIELFEVAAVSPRVLNASTYFALNRWMLERAGSASDAPRRAQDPNLVSAHPSVWIDNEAVTIGPVVLGEGVRLLSGATIVGPSVIGAGTTVHAGATVTRSIIWNGCEIGERAFVDQSILADGAVVGVKETVSGLLRVATPRRRRVFSFGSKPDVVSSGTFVKPALS